MGTICTHQQMVGQAGLYTGFSHSFLPSPSCTLLLQRSAALGSFLNSRTVPTPCGDLPRVHLLSCSWLQLAPWHNLALIRQAHVLPKAQLANTVPELGTPSEEKIRTKSAYWHAEYIGDWDRQNAYEEKGVEDSQRVVDDPVK